VADGGLTTGFARVLGALRRRPAAACVALSALTLGLAWRRFLDGRHSPFATDIEHYHDPVTRELARAWSEGRVPLWTDRVYCGFPFFADPQTAAWYPGTLLVVGLGPHAGYILFLLLHSLLAALGTLGLVRSHGGAWPAAWASGLVVALSGYFAHETQHPGLFAILTWIPTWLWATHGVFLRPTPGRAAAAALPVAMMVFAGTLQVLFGAAIVYAFYVAGLALDALRDRGRRDALRALAVAVGAQLLGLSLAAVVLLPTFAHFPHTARALGMTYEFGSMGSVHPVQLLGTFVNSAAATLGRGALLDFEGASFYLGALALPLALVGLLTARRALPLALALAAAVIALLALGRHGPLYPLLKEWLPGAVGSLRGVGRALGPGTVCIAVLAGLGLQRLGEPGAWVRWLLVVLLAAGLACYAFVFWVAPESIRGATLSSALVLAAALALWALSWRHPRVLQRGLAALVAVDLIAFGALDGVLDATPAPPDPEHLAGNLPALGEIARGSFGDAGERVLLHGFGPRNLPFLDGLDGVGGYNPLLLLRYLDFVSLANGAGLYPRTPLDRFVHFKQPGRVGSPLVDAASIRYVISTWPLEEDGLRFIKQFPGSPMRPKSARLYENEHALPRAYLAYRTLRATGPEELAGLLGPGFDGRRSSVVEGDAPRLDGPAEITPVVAVRERPELLRFDIAPEHPAVLVVSDTWYPGWRASVDGVASPVHRVNALFRGVAVPAGARRVEMRFDPWTFRAGAALSIAAAVVILVLAAVAFRDERRD